MPARILGTYKNTLMVPHSHTRCGIVCDVMEEKRDRAHRGMGTRVCTIPWLLGTRTRISSKVGIPITFFSQILRTR